MRRSVPADEVAVAEVTVTTDVDKAIVVKGVMGKPVDDGVVAVAGLVKVAVAELLC